MMTKRTCRRVLLGLTGLAMIGAGGLMTTIAVASPKGANMKVDARVEAPKLIVVRVRHDMCPLCKQVDPKIPKLIRQTNDDAVLFVTLDLTNETTQKQAALIVGALGIKSVWTGDLTELGSFTFIHGATKKIISSVQTVNTKEIQAALREALNSLQG